MGCVIEMAIPNSHRTFTQDEATERIVKLMRALNAGALEDELFWQLYDHIIAHTR